MFAQMTIIFLRVVTCRFVEALLGGITNHEFDSMVITRELGGHSSKCPVRKLFMSNDPIVWFRLFDSSSSQYKYIDAQLDFTVFSHVNGRMRTYYEQCSLRSLRSVFSHFTSCHALTTVLRRTTTLFFLK
jgi:hypothetical protein